MSERCVIDTGPPGGLGAVRTWFPQVLSTLVTSGNLCDPSPHRLVSVTFTYTRTKCHQHVNNVMGAYQAATLADSLTPSVLDWIHHKSKWNVRQ